MVNVKVSILRRSVTVPVKNFVGVPAGGNDGDVLTKVGTQTQWAAPSSGGSAATPSTQNFTSSTSVHVMHNKGKKPLVDVFDAFGNKVFANVRHDSVNDFYVEFSVATSGSISYF